MRRRKRSINIRGILKELDRPGIMGVLNITPDSFYRGSRYDADESLVAAAGKMLGEGADFIDVGGYSSRPGAEEIPEEVEKGRVTAAIKAISGSFPDAVISVDTFRTGVAEEAIRHGASIINDISGGEADPGMFDLVASLNVPYILMHMQGTPATMQKDPQYDDVVADILSWMGDRIVKLHSMGVKDIIIDPGFGFGKTTEHNFELLRRLDEFAIAGLPVLAGLSRKSMIWKTLGITADEALNGTTALNFAALMNGADILRVHDVKEAVETVRLYEKLTRHAF